MIEQGDEGHQLFVIRPSVMSGFFGNFCHLLGQKSCVSCKN